MVEKNKDMEAQAIDEEKKDFLLTESELKVLIEQVETEVIETIQHSEQFTGPIPHPAHMQQYKEIDPSFPDRILKMAESNLKHTQSIAKTTMFSQLFMGFLGWATPSVISGYVIYHAIVFTQEEKSIEAIIALITALATLGGAFYIKKRIHTE